MSLKCVFSSINYTSIMLILPPIQIGARQTCCLLKVACDEIMSLARLFFFSVLCSKPKAARLNFRRQNLARLIRQSRRERVSASKLSRVSNLNQRRPERQYHFRRLSSFLIDKPDTNNKCHLH